MLFRVPLFHDELGDFLTIAAANDHTHGPLCRYRFHNHDVGYGVGALRSNGYVFSPLLRIPLDSGIHSRVPDCQILRGHNNSYEVMESFPGVQWLWITIAFTLLNFLLWSWACGVGLFVLFAEQREEKRLMAQAFFNMLAQMKKKKAEEAEAKKKEEAEKQTEGTDSK